MDSDEPRRRGGRPRRPPQNRQGRGRPAPRRMPGRAGTPRRNPPGRPQRPVPPPRPPYEDDERAYGDGPGYGRPPYQEGPGYQDGPAYQGGPGPRGGRPHQNGPVYRGGSAHQGVPAFQGGPGYQDDAGCQDGPGYPDGAVYQDGFGYHDASGYDDEAGYEDVDGALPPPRDDDAGGKANKRGKRPKRGGRPGKGRPAKQAGGPAKGRSGGKVYFGAAVVLCLLLVAGVGAVTVLRGGDETPAGDATGTRIGTPADTGPSPKSYSSSASASAYAGIASRRADPGPLKIGEVFPSSAARLSVPDGEVRVKLRGKRLDGDCAAAVWGATVAEVLGEGGCTQAARGLYSGGEDGYALAVAVFNLAGSKDADRFVATLEDTIGSGFVLPLQAPAPLNGFGRGFGMARGLAMGHFAVVTWAQRLDGKGGPQDEPMLSLLIEGGQNPAVLGRAARASD